ncbi:hypothetical protein HR12_08405 [Microbacterium sp. SUBG005]|nr:hypothetical protein HR12_08405 [Microbacterium sp. SUBG005]
MLDEGDVGVGDGEGVREEGRGDGGKASSAGAFGSGEAFAGGVEVPDGGRGASGGAADASFEACDEPVVEEPVQDSDAGAGSGGEGGVVGEEHIAQVRGRGIPVPVQERQNLFVADR